MTCDAIKNGRPRMKLIGFSLIVFLAGDAIAASLFDDGEDYLQSGCEVDNERAVIWMATPSDIREGRKNLYNIEFQPQGSVIRFPPQFYAPDWKDIDSITMEYPNRNADTGKLFIRIRETSNSTYIQRIGLVKRVCWNKAERFIKQVLSIHGVVIRLIERKVTK